MCVRLRDVCLAAYHFKRGTVNSHFLMNRGGLSAKDALALERYDSTPQRGDPESKQPLTFLMRETQKGV